MRPRYSLCNLLLATLICALGILGYRQASRIKRLELEVAIHKELQIQTEHVLQKETKLRLSIEEAIRNQDAPLATDFHYTNVPVAFIRRTRHNARPADEPQVRKANLQLMRQRALRGDVEKILRKQLEEY